MWSIIQEAAHYRSPDTTVAKRLLAAKADPHELTRETRRSSACQRLAQSARTRVYWRDHGRDRPAVLGHKNRARTRRQHGALKVLGAANMSHVLEAALAEVAKLPVAEQDALATLLLDEIKSEQRWSASFAASQHVLANLADEALAEFQAGKTKTLDDSL